MTTLRSNHGMIIDNPMETPFNNKFYYLDSNLEKCLILHVGTINFIMYVRRLF